MICRANVSPRLPHDTLHIGLALAHQLTMLEGVPIRNCQSDIRKQTKEENVLLGGKLRV
jgi:hypothetical protein